MANVLALILLIFASSANAAYSGNSKPPLPKISSPVPASASGRYADVLDMGGGATLQSRYDLNIKNLPALATGAQSLTPQQIAKLAKPFAKRAGLIGLGITVADLIWDEATQTLMAPDPAILNPTNRYWSGHAPCSSNSQSCLFPVAAQNVCQLYNANGSYQGFINVIDNGNQVTFRCRHLNVNGNTYETLASVNRATGTYPAPMAPASDSDIESRISAHLSATGAGATVLEKIIDLGGDSEVIAELPSVSLDGDTSIAGDSSTSTTTDTSGTTTTTSETNYDITYQGDNITITENTTITTTHPDGSTTVTTSSSAGGQQLPPPPQELKFPVFCEWATVVCDFIEWFKAEPTPPVQPELPVTDIVLPDYNSGLGNGSCPSPVSASFMGKPITYPFTDACWAATNVFKPILLLLAGIAAVYIVTGTRST